MNFQKLIELREDSSLKQKDIANVLNITQQTYSLWENGTKIIPLKHLNSLCNYYDVSMDYVLGLSNVRQYDIVNRVIDKKIIGIKLKEFRKKRILHKKNLLIFLILPIQQLVLMKVVKRLSLRLLLIRYVKDIIFLWIIYVAE